MSATAAAAVSCIVTTHRKPRVLAQCSPHGCRVYLRNVSRMRAPLHSGADAPFCCAGVGVTPAVCSTATGGDVAAAHEVTSRHTMERRGHLPSFEIRHVQERESCHLLLATLSEGWAAVAVLHAKCHLHHT